MYHATMPTDALLQVRAGRPPLRRLLRVRMQPLLGQVGDWAAFLDAGLTGAEREEIRAGDPQVRDGVIRTLRRVGQTQEWYDAAPDIYGCFATRSEACLALLGAA